MTGTKPFQCFICGEHATKGPDWAVFVVDCPTCGKYEVDSSVGLLGRSEESSQIKISGWIREQNEAGIIPRMIPDLQRRVGAMSLPYLNERAAKFLKAFASRFGDMESWHRPQDIAQDLDLIAVSYSSNSDEVSELIKILVFEGKLLERAGLIQLNVPGLLAVEAMKTRGKNSAQGFVAMDFDSKMNDAWTNGFDPAIRAAGFTPIRIDAKDYVGGITDEIMAEIRQARFVVADYTGQKAGVYFEAGFALGLGLVVIPTCRDDEIDKLHFDIRHLNTLSWKNPANLADALAKRIRAVIGAGPNAV